MYPGQDCRFHRYRGFDESNCCQDNHKYSKSLSAELYRACSLGLGVNRYGRRGGKMGLDLSGIERIPCFYRGNLPGSPKKAGWHIHQNPPAKKRHIYSGNRLRDDWLHCPGPSGGAGTAAGYLRLRSVRRSSLYGHQFILENQPPYRLYHGLGNGADNRLRRRGRRGRGSGTQVAWARVALGLHTRAQVAVGALLSLAIVTLVFYLFGIIGQ